MARKRKTFDVQEFKEFINSKLALEGLSQVEKMGFCMVLEHVLHKTGNYNGFNNLYWLNGGYEEWKAAGEPSFPAKESFITGPDELEFDRKYY